MLINTIEALQQLYVALGGNIADVQNITITPEMISALTEVAAAAASELPAVTSTDNGKMLTVVSGKWAKANPPTKFVQGWAVYTVPEAAMNVPKASYQSINETSVLGITFTLDGGALYWFNCYKSAGSDIYFGCTVRGESSTTYYSFKVNKSATSASQQITMNVKTVNDPA